MTTPDPHVPTQPDPVPWGAGLPEPGTARRQPGWFRVAWTVWCLAWALVWITVGWLFAPMLVNVPMAVASLAAIFAVHRPPDPTRQPPR
jgi:hypothetical protein